MFWAIEEQPEVVAICYCMFRCTLLKSELKPVELTRSCCAAMPACEEVMTSDRPSVASGIDMQNNWTEAQLLSSIDV